MDNTKCKEDGCRSFIVLTNYCLYYSLSVNDLKSCAYRENSKQGECKK